MKVLGIVGYSGSGKTRLLERLIPALNAAGVSVSTMKHTHHKVRLDASEDLSRKLAEAGAVDVAEVGPERWALLHENEPGPEPLIEDLAARMSPVDLLLVEGFKRHPHAKIEVHRPSVGKPLLCREDPHIIAVATDGPLPLTGLPILDLNDVASVARFIIERMELEAGQPHIYRIRCGEPADAPRLPEIEHDGADAFRELGMENVAALPTMPVEQYRAAIDEGLVWVAEDAAGRVVGFAAAMIIDGQVHLAEIDVLRQHRRRRIGRRLIAALADWARESGYQAVTLTTFRDVPMNAPFYERLGFRPLDPGADHPELAAIREAERELDLGVPRIAMQLIL